MSLSKKQLISRGAIALFLFGGTTYHVYSVENLEEDLEKANKNLEQQEENFTSQIKAKTEELEELESNYKNTVEDLVNKKGELEKNQELLSQKEKEIEQKKKEIEQLQKDLQAKREREARIASVQSEEELVVEPDGDSNVTVKAVSHENDKSAVLSNESEAKSEQSEVKKPESEQKTNIGTFNITYYSAYDGSQIGVTAGGTSMANGNIHTDDGYRIIATDPNVIPLGTVVEVTTSNGEKFMARADDTGGKIQGNRIDIAVSNPDKAFELGRGTATVRVVE